jgi:hypothetical protein
MRCSSMLEFSKSMFCCITSHSGVAIHPDKPVCSQTNIANTLFKYVPAYGDAGNMMCSLARETPGSLGARETPVSLGARETPVSLGARETPVSLGARETPVSLGARETPVSLETMYVSNIVRNSAGSVSIIFCIFFQLNTIKSRGVDVLYFISGRPLCIYGAIVFLSEKKQHSFSSPERYIYDGLSVHISISFSVRKFVTAKENAVASIKSIDIYIGGTQKIENLFIFLHECIQKYNMSPATAATNTTRWLFVLVTLWGITILQKLYIIEELISKPTPVPSTKGTEFPSTKRNLGFSSNESKSNDTSYQEGAKALSELCVFATVAISIYNTLVALNKPGHREGAY